MKDFEKQAALNEQYVIINDREAWLRNTDYIAAKIAEGKATKTEYATQIAQRQSWRDEINAAQDEIIRLETEDVDDEPVNENPS